MPRPTLKLLDLKVLVFSSKTGMVGFLKKFNSEDDTDVNDVGLL